MLSAQAQPLIEIPGRYIPQLMDGWVSVRVVVLANDWLEFAHCPTLDRIEQLGIFADI
jgi:hypothetical protein